MLLSKHERGRVIPDVTQEYSLGFHCNSRNAMRLLPCHRIRPDSPVLRAEKFCVSKKTCKEP